MRLRFPNKLAALFTLALGGQAQTYTYTWNPVRIVAGGYIPAIIAHPTEPGLRYARTDIGSVYRWDAPNNNWIPLTDFNSPTRYNLNGPESIALDPTDPNRLYIAAGMYTCNGCAFAMLVSTDRGATFETNPVPFPMGANNDGRSAGERLAVNPFRPNQLLMGTRTKGLWRSDNYASTWTQVDTFPIASSSDGFGIQWVLFDPANAGKVYAGSYTNATIYRSSDEGATWEPVPNQPRDWPFSVAQNTKPPAAQRAVFNGGFLYVIFNDIPGPNSISYGFLDRYNPKDDSWTIVTPPVDLAGGESSQRGGFAGLTHDPNRPGILAVSTLDRWYPIDSVYVTRDAGATWTDLSRLTNYAHQPSVYTPISPYLNFGGSNARFGWWISALLLDPTNPNHLLFGTGATIYATDNLSAPAPAWHVEAQGIEETAVIALISPTEGAHLLSGVGDIGGFRHDDFTKSPALGMYSNPVATTVGSLDWAGQAPNVIVRTQSPANQTSTPCTFGALSTDGGTTWSPMPACAAGTNTGNGGSLAVDASGNMLFWNNQYSNDGGQQWTASQNFPARGTVVSDKVAAGRFYAFSAGNFFSFQNNSWTQVNKSPLPNASGTPRVNFDREGDVWLALGGNGLFHSVDGGQNWTKAPGITQASSVAIGAAPRHRSTQAVYVANNQGILRSTDNGQTWIRINDDQHQYGGPTLIQADPRVFGRVYLGMNGRGIIYGDPVSQPLR